MLILKIAVVGANGRTGQRVIAQALERGFEVVGLARRPQAITMSHERLATRRADVMDEVTLKPGLEGVDAVISAIGIGSTRKPTRTYSTGVGNVLAAMQANDIRRLAVVSASPVGPRSDHPWFERTSVLPILEAFFGETYKDMRVMEGVLQASSADWVSLRPPRLLAKPALGNYRIGLTPPANGRSLRYADLATALLDAIDNPDNFRTAQYVSN